MKKIDEAIEIMQSIGLSEKLHNERSALTLLALCNIKRNSNWSNAKSQSMSVVGNKSNPKYPGIMRFIAKYYNKEYAENSRETIRRQTLHQFIQAGILLHNPDNPSLPTNSKDNHYKLTPDFIDLIQSYKTKYWENKLKNFIQNLESLQKNYKNERRFNKISVKLDDGKKLTFSPGIHNKLQIDIIKEFAPRFIPGGDLLYVGDTAKKKLYIQKESMSELNIPYDEHKKLPDLIFYFQDKNWILLIEAVTSHGPVSQKRMIELKESLKQTSCELIFISAFPNTEIFKKYAHEIAWETEVWIADIPDHMIHFNGEKFIGSK